MVRLKEPRLKVPPLTETDVALTFEPRFTVVPGIVMPTAPKFCVPVLSVHVRVPKMPLMFKSPVVFRNVPPLFTVTLPAPTVRMCPLRLRVPVEAVAVPTVSPQEESTLVCSVTVGFDVVVPIIICPRSCELVTPESVIFCVVPANVKAAISPPRVAPASAVIFPLIVTGVPNPPSFRLKRPA